MLVKIFDGLVRIGRVNKHAYYWAVAQAYLFAMSTGNNVAKNILLRELRAGVVDVKDDFIKALVRADEAKKYCAKHNRTIVELAKCLLLDRIHYVYGNVRRWMIERKVESEIDKLIDSGDVAKIRVAGLALLYLKIAYSNAPNKYRWVELRRNAILKKLGDKEGDNIVFRLGGGKVNSDVLMMKPQYWFAWR